MCIRSLHFLLINTPRLRLKSFGLTPASPVVPDEKKMKRPNTHVQLTKTEKILFELIQLSPVFVVLSLLFTTSDFLLTLVVFHVLLIYLPLLFLKKKKMEHALLPKINEHKKLDAAKKYGFFFFIVPLVGIVFTHLIFKTLFLKDFIADMKLPSFSSPLYTILLFIDFVIVNPVVEELFWRIFCHLFVEESTWRGKLNIAFHFAIYHWFVVYYISQSALIATLIAGSVLLLGSLLTELKKRYGIFAAIIMHVGVDLAAGIALWDMHSNFL